jgi:hypothetical protein
VSLVPDFSRWRYFGLMAHQNNRLSPSRKLLSTRSNTSQLKVAGRHLRLKDRYVHALPKLQSVCAKAAALPKLRSNHAARSNNVAI